MRQLKTCHWFVPLIATAACSGSSNVGSEPCPSGWACSTGSLSLSRGLDEVTTSVETLTPAFTRSLDDIMDGPANLVTSKDDSLWLFGAHGDALGASRLALDGNVLENRDFEAPAGVVSPPNLSALYFSPVVANHPMGPLVSIAWAERVDVPPSDPTRPESGYYVTATPEWLVFGEDLSNPPVRIQLPQYAHAQQLSTAARTQDGQGVIALPDPTSVVRIDLRGQVVWERPLQPALKTLVASLPVDPRGNPTAIAALSPEGVWTLPVREDVEIRSSVWESQPLGLLSVSDDDGSLVLKRYSLDTSIKLLDNNRAAVAYDADGEAWHLHSVEGGDLVALRTGDNPRGLRFTREAYLDLSLIDTSVAPDGSIFLSTLSGGRDPSTHSALVCRIVASAGRCYGLPELPIDMAAVSANVLYTLSSAGLSRFDLPD